ncbi:type II secretion protein ATPase [Enterovibrio sp. ZSDZ35]|uniref:Type II secretion protein ATPase n=1 Tax=Enterovibrio qingdaonensis TaxID=2899818 RepID=A0ABT5QLI2_9GAMM|nr:type II secretion protein ATPase [Enterovibrio sp. ZSDZ35]MDD1781729.1 type II secretion protein ATPase [Enterovibrio sp. ZSDZ35]
MIFDELLKKESTHESSNLGNQTGIKVIQFYQTDQHKSLVEETFRFIGESAPSAEKYTFSDVAKQVEALRAQVAIIELTHCEDTLEECRRLSERLPNTLSVLILGSTDSISLVRELKAFGFYYLLWPITKVELGEFIEGVFEQHEAANFKHRRRAKRIGVIGSRGGIGVSMITAELGWQLANDKQASCVVVDNNYLSGNLDIFLGVKNREKRKLNAAESGGQIDESAAKALVTRINHRLEYLALGLTTETSTDFYDINNAVVNNLCRDANFIVDDLSASISFDLRPSVLMKQLDVAVVVMDPTISCLRETAALLNSIKKHIEENELRKTVRVVLVLNKHRMSRFQSVTEAEITKYLNAPIDVVLPYEITAEEALVSGNMLSSGKTKLGGQLRSLCSLIVGEVVTPNRVKSFLPFLRKKDV